MDKQTNPKQSFELYEKVWGKIFGHPYWPCFIYKKGNQKEDDKVIYGVHFFGDDSIAELTNKHLCSYTEGFERGHHQKTKYNKLFNSALEESYFFKPDDYLQSEESNSEKSDSNSDCHSAPKVKKLKIQVVKKKRGRPSKKVTINFKNNENSIKKIKKEKVEVEGEELKNKITGKERKEVGCSGNEKSKTNPDSKNVLLKIVTPIISTEPVKRKPGRPRINPVKEIEKQIETIIPLKNTDSEKSMQKTKPIIDTRVTNDPNLIFKGKKRKRTSSISERSESSKSSFSYVKQETIDKLKLVVNYGEVVDEESENKEKGSNNGEYSDNEESFTEKECSNPNSQHSTVKDVVSPKENNDNEVNQTKPTHLGVRFQIPDLTNKYLMSLTKYIWCILKTYSQEVLREERSTLSQALDELSITKLIQPRIFLKVSALVIVLRRLQFMCEDVEIHKKLTNAIENFETQTLIEECGLFV